MDKKTLGGKKKLVFEPKMPTEPMNTHVSSGTKPVNVEVKRKEVKRKEAPAPHVHRAPEPAVTLIGGAKETKSFMFSSGSTQEIANEDLLRIENAPLTVDKIADAVRSKEVSGFSLDLGPKKKVLLQLPNLLPEENRRYIKGKLRIEENEIYLTVAGRVSANAPMQDFLFRITPVDMGMPQEAYKKEDSQESLRRIGQVDTKFISSLVRDK
ncbi:uncharacterized protein NEMAJ01_1443 [Nematocida major]|uniref:uncharacterized protein n=1 Tax=Nematocida major TaxID=1912982 RepID=UPI0020088405|nr:uncharacterized protein NEMAJ01_1443 [Nematocida major]KAH9386547.1 hypothetical protein NEMAJ01_1443 [Nematocida major]